MVPVVQHRQAEISSAAKQKSAEMADLHSLLSLSKLEHPRPHFLECILGGSFIMQHSLTIIEERNLVFRIQPDERLVAARKKRFLICPIRIAWRRRIADDAPRLRPRRW